jgi:hypothetical protein
MCDECDASLEIYEKLKPVIPLLEKMMKKYTGMIETRGYETSKAH